MYSLRFQRGKQTGVLRLPGNRKFDQRLPCSTFLQMLCRPLCISDDTIPEESIDSSMNSRDFSLALTFRQSRSSKYPFAVKLAKGFDSYCEEDDDDEEEISHSVQLVSGELRQHDEFTRLLSLLNIVSAWKHTTLTISGKTAPSDAWRHLARVGECYQRQRRSGNPYHYCNGFDPRHSPTCFGCRLLTSVDRSTPLNGRQRPSERGWYSYGELDGYIFRVDRKKILTMLKDEAEKNFVHACPAYHEKAIAEEVNSLPKSIDVRKDSGFVICNRRNGELGIRLKSVYESSRKDDKPKERRFIDVSTERAQKDEDGNGNGGGNSTSGGDSTSGGNGNGNGNGTKKKDPVEIAPDIDIRQIPEVTFSDVCGQDESVAAVRDWVELPLKHPELFDHIGVPTHVGILLYGPPGTGKTLLAQAVAGESNAHLEIINGPEILSKWVGQSEETMRGIFDRAKRLAPSVILLDEVDAVAPARDRVLHGHEVTLVSQLLTLMDGLYDRGQVIIIATTNRLEAVDPALRRPGRFDYSIHLGMPDCAGREAIFKRHLADMAVSDEVVPSELAEKSDGMCGADIAKVCREAGLHCVKEAIRAGYTSVENVQIEMKHLLAALEGGVPGGSETSSAPKMSGGPEAPGNNASGQ